MFMSITKQVLQSKKETKEQEREQNVKLEKTSSKRPKPKCC